MACTGLCRRLNTGKLERSPSHELGIDLFNAESEGGAEVGGGATGILATGILATSNCFRFERSSGIPWSSTSTSPVEAMPLISLCCCVVSKVTFTHAGCDVGTWYLTFVVSLLNSASELTWTLFT